MKILPVDIASIWRKLIATLTWWLLIHKQNVPSALASADGADSLAAAATPPEVFAWTANEDSWNYWWSYSGVSGPAYWGLLNLNWFICDKGRKQSPINIETKALVYDPHLTRIKLDNNLISGVLYNDGHAIVLNCSASAHFHAVQLKLRQEKELAKGRLLLTGNKENGTRSRREAGKLEELFAEKSSNSFPNSIELSIAGETGTDSSQLQLPVDSLLNLNAAEELAGSQAANDEQAALNQQAARVQVSGAGLAYNYTLEAIYLRFGQEDSAGSEHQINSRPFPAELQVISYNSILYGSFSEAASKPNGLLAISILVERAKGDSAGQNHPLGLLLDQAKQIKFRGDWRLVKEVNLFSLLPDLERFIRYEGSLTTPACSENVSWLVLNKPLYISQSNLNTLRSISADERTGSSSGSFIANNRRPIQPINNRLIRTNIRPSKLDERQGNFQNPETCRRLWTKYEYKESENK